MNDERQPVAKNGFLVRDVGLLCVSGQCQKGSESIGEDHQQRLSESSYHGEHLVGGLVWEREHPRFVPQ
jgi:hypothetical protein